MKKNLIAIVGTLLSLSFLATSCGPELKKQPVGEMKISLKAEKSDLGDIEIGTPTTFTLSVIGENLTQSISLTSDNAEATITPNALPVLGGKVTVTLSPSKEGPVNFTIKAVSANVNSSIDIHANAIKKGDNPEQNGSLTITSRNDNGEDLPVKEIALGQIVVAENYFADATLLKTTALRNFNMMIRGTGLQDTPIKIAVEGNDGQVFSINKDEFTCKPGKAKAGGTLQVSSAPTNEGSYTCTIVVTYGTHIERIPVSLTLKKGPADVVEGEGNGAESKSSAELFGSRIPNGATIKISTATLHNSCLTPHIKLHFPDGGYRGVLTLEKECEFSWCITGNCVRGMKDTGENGIKEKDTDLLFEVVDKLPVGYTNKLHFVFTKGNDKYEFTIDINISHASE